MRPKKPARKPAAKKAAPNGKTRKRPNKAMKLRSSAFALALAIPLAWAAANTAPHAFSAPNQYEGVVTRIVDGDTFYLDNVETRIRLWGLDAPERGQPGGNAAKRALREIAHGERLRCKEVDIDRYGRIVGQCFLSDGRDVAAMMIESGNGRDYVRYSGGYYSTR